jgi:hypothetical protein
MVSLFVALCEKEMKLSTDPDQYLKQQEVFTGEMIARIADHLEQAGINDNQLKELTGQISFEIACMIDGVSEMKFEGEEANPYLTFINSENELIHLGGNSTSHEMVYGILNAMFSEDPKR